MSAVYGFKVVTFALCVNGILYPLYFDFVKKKVEGHPEPDKAILYTKSRSDPIGF